MLEAQHNLVSTIADWPNHIPGADWPERVEWRWMRFDELQPATLYAALQLRQQIFIVEQGVPYSDIDGGDLKASHLFCFLDGRLAGYLRTLPADQFALGYTSFGRVVVHARCRRLGIARQLVARAIEQLAETEPGIPIKISSQLYLRDFYASFQFVAQGQSYIEDRIPHIAMIRSCDPK
ncbi:GNAT family N-acetyltransferase [Hyphomicrobium sp. 2TAF46]|uniref:GNAT family N-acetyltransferase n=1 Tax=Hyphomicrobium sp. 2TAF46 TaxID=3233019 RepID=UPI003F8F1EB5